MVIALIAVIVAQSLAASALLFKTHQGSVRALKESHERTTQYTADLLDRLMSADYGTYRAFKEIEQIREEEIDNSKPEPLVPTLGPDRGGFGSRLGLRALSVRAYGDGSEESEQLMLEEVPSS